MRIIAVDRVTSPDQTVSMTKEVSNTIMIDGIEIENTQEAIRAFHENNRKVMERQRAEQNQREKERQTGKLCPMDRFSSFQKECKTDCALYRDGGCTLKRREPATETEGRSCPFMRSCTKQCALYDCGCTM